MTNQFLSTAPSTEPDDADKAKNSMDVKLENPGTMEELHKKVKGE